MTHYHILLPLLVLVSSVNYFSSGRNIVLVRSRLLSSDNFSSGCASSSQMPNIENYSQNVLNNITLKTPIPCRVMRDTPAKGKFKQNNSHCDFDTFKRHSRDLKSNELISKVKYPKKCALFKSEPCRTTATAPKLTPEVFSNNYIYNIEDKLPSRGDIISEESWNTKRISNADKPNLQTIISNIYQSRIENSRDKTTKHLKTYLSQEDDQIMEERRKYQNFENVREINLGMSALLVENERQRIYGQLARALVLELTEKTAPSAAPVVFVVPKEPWISCSVCREDITGLLDQALAKSSKWPQILTTGGFEELALMPTPRAFVLVIIDQGRLRLALNRRLYPLLESSLWNPDVPLILLHVQPLSDAERDARDIQRALARGEIHRASCVAAVGGMVTVVVLKPWQRPARTPPLIPATSLALHRKERSNHPDIRGHTLFFGLYSDTEAEERACLEGKRDWDSDPGSLMAWALSKSLGVRPQCATKIRAMPGARLPRGTYTGMAAELHARRVDFLFMEVLVSPVWQIENRLLYPNNYEDCCIYVSRPERENFLESARGAFTPAAWAAAGATLAALLVSLWATLCASAAPPNPSAGPTAVTLACSAAFAAYVAFLTGAFRLPVLRYERRVAAALARALVLVTALYGFVFLNMFQGSLTSFLAAPRLESAPDTLREADARVTRVFSYEGLAGIMVSDSDPDPVFRSIAAKVSPLTNQSEWMFAMDAVAHRLDTAALMRRSHAFFYLRSPRYFRDGVSLLHLVRECVFSAGSAHFVAARRSPYFSPLNAYAQRVARDAGLWDHFWQRSEPAMRRRFSLARVRPETKGQPLRPYPLTVAHLRAAFAVGAGGVAAAAVAAAGEAVASRRAALKGYARRIFRV